MPDAKKTVILQHVPQENAGTILDFLKAQKIPYEAVNLWEEDCSFPNLGPNRPPLVPQFLCAFLLGNAGGRALNVPAGAADRTVGSLKTAGGAFP